MITEEHKGCAEEHSVLMLTNLKIRRKTQNLKPKTQQLKLEVDERLEVGGDELIDNENTYNYNDSNGPYR